jgi:hypothetical protein
MGRRVLIIALAAATLIVPALLGSGCGSPADAAPQPSFSPVEQPRLANLGDFALLGERPMHIWLHLDKSQRVRIAFLAERRVKSCTLWHVAPSDGSLAKAEQMPLEGGTPHANGGPEVAYWFGSASLAPGYYRLDLEGRGRIISLVIDRRR